MDLEEISILSMRAVDEEAPGTTVTRTLASEHPAGRGSPRLELVPEPEAVEGQRRNDADEGQRPRSVVSWEELERIADEAADVDAIVRRELSSGTPIDAAPLVAMMRSEWPRRRGWPARLLIVASVIGLGAVLVTNARVDHPGALPSRETPTAAPSSSASPSVRAAPPPTMKIIESRLTFSAPCWVLAVADDRTVLQQTLSSGTRTIRASHTLDLTLGNAGGVQIRVDGKTVPIGGSTGDVVHLSFALRDGRVVVS